MNIIDANIADGATIEVYWQDEVSLDVDVALMYVKSGQKEIDAYVQNVSKPDINNYIETEAKPIVSEVVVNIAEPTVYEYIENTVKPDIDEFTNSRLDTYNANAEEKTLAFNTDYDSKVSAFNSNADEKIATVNAGATLATEQAIIATTQAETATTSALSASQSASNAKTSETNAKNSEISAAQSAVSAANSASRLDKVVSDAKTEISKELNNPFSLLDYKWSEYEITNASWLLSNGQFNSGATYISVYNLLLEIYNGTVTKDGVSVKMSTDAYEDTDFVLNTADTTFRLPIKVKLASGNVVVGNGMTLGLTNGTGNSGLTSGNVAISEFTAGYGAPVGTSTTGTGLGGNMSLGITTEPTKSGIETSSSGLKLYFYVGETIQDANVIAASQVLTEVAKKTDSVQAAAASMPSDKYINLTVGASGTAYTAPANGYFQLLGVGTDPNNACGVYIYSSDNGESVFNSPFVVRETAWATVAVGVIYSILKGKTVKIGYDRVGFSLSGYSNLGLKFIYAEGDK